MAATYVAAMDDLQEYGAGRKMVESIDPHVNAIAIATTLRDGRWVPALGWTAMLRDLTRAARTFTVVRDTESIYHECASGERVHVRTTPARPDNRPGTDRVLVDRKRAAQWADQIAMMLEDDSDGAAREDIKGDKGTIDMRAARGDSTTGIETNYDPIAPALASIGAGNPAGTSAPLESVTFWQAAQDGLSSMRGPRRSIGQFTHQIWRTWEAPRDVSVYHECASGERVLVRTFTPSPVEQSADIRAYAARAARVRRQGTRAAQVWAALSSEYRHKRTAIRRVKWAATVTPESRAARITPESRAANAANMRRSRAANPIVSTPESRAADALRKRNARAAKVAKENTAQSYY